MGKYFVELYSLGGLDVLMRMCFLGTGSSVEPAANVAMRKATTGGGEAGLLDVGGGASPPPVLVEKVHPKDAASTCW